MQKLSKTLGQATDATLGYDIIMTSCNYYVSFLYHLNTVSSCVCFHFVRSLYPLWLVVLKTIDTVCINRDKHVISLVELGKEVAEYTSKHDDHLKGNVRNMDR